MDDFDIAHAAGERTACTLRALGLDPITTADAFMTVALAIWAAEKDRLSDAVEMLRGWTEARDGN